MARPRRFGEVISWRTAVCLGAAAAALLACGGTDGHGAQPVTLRFWAFGREGEVVQALVPAFERTHPGIHVRVEQIPFTAAHEKLLTAVVGRATPDVAQLGNTWLPELAALRAVVPLDSLIDRSPVIDRHDYFSGVWTTNVLNDTTYGVPWYVDTRVLFYRSDLLAEAGYAAPPTTWSEWRAALRQIRARSAGKRYGILLPVNEWAQPIILAMAAGAPLLRDGDRYGDFAEPRFKAAFSFYVGLYRDSLARPISDVQIENLYQSFARGDFAMFISGPWDVGECLRRLPSAMRGRWMTAPMPVPDRSALGIVSDSPPSRDDSVGPGTSLAGGSSLVIFRGSAHWREAWSLLEYLSAPAQQAAFYRLAEDLPARQSAWHDSAIVGNAYVQAFARQLAHVRPTPKVPEWDQIATLVTDYGEAVVRGATPATEAMSSLDRDVDRVLEKRRWILARSPAATASADR